MDVDGNGDETGYTGSIENTMWLDMIADHLNTHDQTFANPILLQHRDFKASLFRSVFAPSGRDAASGECGR